MLVPAKTPVTTPPVTIAVALLLLHTPPAAASLSVITDPAHTPEGPVMVPALGEELTVTNVVAAAVPQPLLTV